MSDSMDAVFLLKRALSTLQQLQSTLGVTLDVIPAPFSPQSQLEASDVADELAQLRAENAALKQQVQHLTAMAQQASASQAPPTISPCTATDTAVPPAAVVLPVLAADTSSDASTCAGPAEASTSDKRQDVAGAAAARTPGSATTPEHANGHPASPIQEGAAESEGVSSHYSSSFAEDSDGAADADLLSPASRTPEVVVQVGKVLSADGHVSVPSMVDGPDSDSSRGSEWY